MVVYISPPNELHLLKPLHLSLGSCQEDTFCDVFVCNLFYISFIRLCSKRTIYRATVRPDLRTTVQWNLDKTINGQGQEIYFRSTLFRHIEILFRVFFCYFPLIYFILLLYCVYYYIIILKTANTSNVQTRRLYPYAVNQSTLSSTTKSICSLQIHCIPQRWPEPTLKERLDKYGSSPRLPRQQNCD